MGARRGGGGKSRRSTPHPRTIPKKKFRFYVAGLLATFSPLWGTFFTMWGPFCYFFFSTWGPFWACPPSPHMKISAGPHGYILATFSPLWGPFCYIFLLMGGLFHHVRDLFATFFLHVGVSFGLPPPLTKISAGPHGYTAPPPQSYTIFVDVYFGMHNTKCILIVYVLRESTCRSLLW